MTRSIAAFGHALDLRLTGSDGALRARWEGLQDVDPEPRVALVVHDRDGTQVEAVSPHTGHAHDLWRQSAAFVHALQGAARPPADARDGRIAVELCLAVERSLREGRALPFASD